jgi:hypothetical protein
MDSVPASWVIPKKLKHPLQMKKISEEEQEIHPAALSSEQVPSSFRRDTFSRVPKQQKSRAITAVKEKRSKRRSSEATSARNSEKKVHSSELRTSEAVSSSTSTAPPQTTSHVHGRAAQTLAAYCKRVRELSHKPKADMVAYKELRHQWTPALHHGHISGVPVGAYFERRGEAAILGVHTQMMRGIDSRQTDPALRSACREVM